MTLVAPGELAPLEREWIDLWERTPGATPFSRPEWLLPWYEHLAFGGGLAVVARRGGRLAGLLPLHRWQEGGRRLLGLAGGPVSDYRDALAEDAAAARALLAGLPAADAVILDDLPERGVLAAVGAGEREQAQVCPELRLDGDAAARWSPGLARNVGYQRRRLARGGRLGHERATAATLDRALEALFAMQRARFGDGCALAGAGVRRFHRAAAPRLLAAGLLRLDLLLLDGAPAAASYVLAARGRAYLHLLAMDPAAARASPGTLACAAAIEAAAAEGCTSFDFLRGDERYKHLFGGLDRPTFRVRAPDFPPPRRRARANIRRMAHPLAGKPAPRELLVDVPRLLAAYADERPDPSNPLERVAFGTSGHRGSSLRRSFNEAHILAVAQAICEYRAAQGVTGPLFLGRDTHALSSPAQLTCLEVFAANGVEVLVADRDAATPTPAVSHAILGWNRGRTDRVADGVVVTPSHNPPEDGGIKYNPPNGGPADTDATGWIEDRANALLAGGNREVRRVARAEALSAPTVHEHDYVKSYVKDLGNVIDVEAIRASGLRLGVDPLGGSNVGYWEPIAATYGLRIHVVNPVVDPTFGFMPLDHDGKIRMDCSSPYAMANLVRMKDDYDLSFGNDADSDRHGIVTRSRGLLNPNHYLAAAIDYLFRSRTGWSAAASVGKTLVSSGLIDRVASRLGRKLVEVPVGFKWFVPGLLDGSLGFGGEESAGASFLRRDGTVWSTDKDGIIMDLLAAEMTARTGRDPGELYAAIAHDLGTPFYARVDAPATPREKAALKRLSPDAVTAAHLAGEPIVAKLTRAPGNGADIGGLKVVAQNGWFAARPSGTEDVYKIYAESFRDEAHLAQLLDEARRIVSDAFAIAGAA